MPYCTQCGEEINPESNFCKYCGAETSSASTSETSQKTAGEKEKTPYMEKVEDRLSREDFEIKRDISPSSYQVELSASKSSWELSKFGKMTRFVLVSSMDDVDIQTIQNYSEKMTKYAIDNRDSFLPRGFGGSLVTFPVIASEDIDSEIKNWIQNNPAEKHFAAFNFPVLASLNDQRIYYCEEKPMWGRAYFGGFQDFAEENLRF